MKIDRTKEGKWRATKTTGRNFEKMLRMATLIPELPG
jgi:hypothetical protein